MVHSEEKKSADCIKTYMPSEANEGQDANAKKVLLWDRKSKGGFPGK
jgi:predicted Rdx family selenoprotein